MTELANIISALRGDQTGEQMAAKVGTSRETILRILRGDTVKLDTLKAIAHAYNLNQTEWLELLVAWIRAEIGTDAQYLTFSPSPTQTKFSSRFRNAAKPLQALLLESFNRLTVHDQKEVIAAIARPEVIRSVQSLNQMYASVEAKSRKKPGQK